MLLIYTHNTYLRFYNAYDMKFCFMTHITCNYVNLLYIACVHVSICY